MRSYGPDTGFRYMCTVTLTLEMSFGQDHDTPLGHGQQLCEILLKEQDKSSDIEQQPPSGDRK